MLTWTNAESPSNVRESANDIATPLNRYVPSGSTRIVFVSGAASEQATTARAESSKSFFIEANFEKDPRTAARPNDLFQETG
ncbi:MAG: hypothetical protein JSR41_25055 [Proteobacteria bacterium]|nr:hypothetical protein [Pseudomonadota bacterium]